MTTSASGEPQRARVTLPDRMRASVGGILLVLAVAAPLFCMGFFHAQRRRLIISHSLTLGIIVLILLIKLLPQPWRGIVDAGVVVGLAWGLVALLIFAVQGLRSADYDYSPEVSEVE